jgi:hypothetical protein
MKAVNIRTFLDGCKLFVAPTQAVADTQFAVQLLSVSPLTHDRSSRLKAPRWNSASKSFPPCLLVLEC